MILKPISGRPRGRAVNQYKDGVLVGTHENMAEAARAIGLANPSYGGNTIIKRVCDGKQKSTKGFTFEYAKEDGRH